MNGLIIEVGETINQTKVFFNGARLEGITDITFHICDRHAAVCMNIKVDKITKQQILKDISSQVFTKGIVFPFRMEKQVQLATLYIREDIRDWRCPHCKEQTKIKSPYWCACGYHEARAYDYR